MATLADVAKEAGVSASTVSRTYTAPHLIHEDTRARVLSAAAMLSYQPMIHRANRDRSSRQQPGHSGSIGFQFFSSMPGDVLSDNLFYAPMLYAAHEEANAQGVNLFVAQTDRRRIEEELPRTIRERGISGMLLVGTADPKILSAFDSLVSRVVLVDVSDPDTRHDCILSDGFTGAFKATRYLLQLGHKTIAFMLGPDAPTFQERYNGYISAHLAAGLTPDPRLVVREDAGEDMEEGLRALLDSPLRPTAIFAANDCIAITAMKVCYSMGVRIPDDMSFIGFDDIAFSIHTLPPLSTVRVDKEYMGRLAVRRILYRMHESPSDIEPAIQIKTQVELVLRDSCAPPKKS